MRYRKFGKLDWEVSVLGFGTMRLPWINGDYNRIDEPKATRILHYAIDHGVNYVDTGWMYHDGNSERFLGRVLKNIYREKVKIATKLHFHSVETPRDFDKILHEQLKRLQTDHIDMYLLHGLCQAGWHKLRDWNVLCWAEKAIADGYIGHLGFSFHDSFPVFKEIVDAYDNWAMCQIQYNFLDENVQAGTKGLHYAAEKGLAIVIMEPLRGGHLANPPQEIREIWDRSKKNPVNMAKIFMLKVEGEEPRYYLDEGANAQLNIEFITRSMKKSRPVIFYSGESGHLTLIMGNFKKLVQSAKQTGCLTIVDTVIPPQGNWNFLYQAAPFIDFLKCNQYEAQSITGKSDMKAALAALEKLGIPLTVVSLAKNGLLFSYNNLCYKVPPFKVRNIDSAGAGDAFNAGIIIKLAQWQGGSLQEQLKDSEARFFDTILFAAASGAKAVTARGCLAGVERSAVLKLLGEQAEKVMAGIESF